MIPKRVMTREFCRMNEGVKEALINLGYTLKDFGQSYRAKPLYRDSNNNTSLSINKESGRFVDFSAQISGSFEELIKLTLNLQTIEEANKWLNDKNINVEYVAEKPKLKYVKALDESFIKDLKPDYSYWEGRGIKKETLEIFGGGVSREGKMNGRYVFPVFDSKKRLLGVAGRDIWNNSDRPKWKILGAKDSFIYPFFVSYNIVRCWDEIVLVESIGDMLALWQAGVKGSLVLFGVDLSEQKLVSLLKLNPKKIIVALNNDSENNLVGNLASIKIQKKLLKHFNPKQVVIGNPAKNDFGEMTGAEILEWKRKIDENS